MARVAVSQLLELVRRRTWQEPNMPKHGDTIIIHSRGESALPVWLGVPIRLERARSKGSFRYTEVSTGKSIDWFAWSLRHAVWSYAA